MQHSVDSRNQDLGPEVLSEPPALAGGVNSAANVVSGRLSVVRDQRPKIKSLQDPRVLWHNRDAMLIERTNNNKITITVSSSVDSFGLQRLIDYVKYLEATAKSKAKQSDVDKLADEVNASWWAKNRKRFIKRR